MIKIITYSVIGLFVVFSILYIFIIDVSVDSVISTPHSQNKKHINDYLITNDFNIKILTNKITSSCLPDDTACKTLELYKYVNTSYLIDNSTNLDNPNPKRAFYNRQGTYIDITLLYSSLLLHSGISTYIKKDGNKFYNYACGISNENMYNTIIQDMHSKPFTNKELTLKKEQIWAFDMSRNNNANLVVDVELYAAEPVDIILFPNKQEMNAHLKNQYSRYNNDCSLFNTTNAKFTCQVPKTGIIIVKSHSNDNKFKCNIYRSGLLIGDIKSEKSKNGNNCIQININNKGNFQYPGIITN